MPGQDSPSEQWNVAGGSTQKNEFIGNQASIITNNQGNFNITYNPTPPPAISGTPSNLPLSGIVQFVGREDALTQVHKTLQAGATVAISSVSGMGGVGKTELALQYALQHWQTRTYPGGICWLNARTQDVGLGLLTFARTQLQLPDPPDSLQTVREQVQWVCRHWQGEPILVVVDDVTDYAAIKPYLAALDTRFRVLLTTRLRLGAPVGSVALTVLTPDSALELLGSLVEQPDRINRQREDAQ